MNQALIQVLQQMQQSHASLERALLSFRTSSWRLIAFGALPQRECRPTALPEKCLVGMEISVRTGPAQADNPPPQDKAHTMTD